MHNSFTQNNYKIDLSIMKKKFWPRKDVLGLKRFFSRIYCELLQVNLTNLIGSLCWNQNDFIHQKIFLIGFDC